MCGQFNAIQLKLYFTQSIIQMAILGNEKHIDDGGSKASNIQLLDVWQMVIDHSE